MVVDGCGRGRKSLSGGLGVSRARGVGGPGAQMFRGVGVGGVGVGEGKVRFGAVWLLPYPAGSAEKCHGRVIIGLKGLAGSSYRVCKV